MSKDCKNNQEESEHLFSESSQSSSAREEKQMFDPKSDPPTTRQIYGLFFKLAIPAILTNVLGILTLLVSAIYAGRMNDLSKLAAVGLANVFCMIMIEPIIGGLNSAQETLTSQAFGAGNIRLCGVYLNRGSFILLAFFIPLAVFPAFYMNDVLLAIGQDPEVARLTKT